MKNFILRLAGMIMTLFMIYTWGCGGSAGVLTSSNESSGDAVGENTTIEQQTNMQTYMDLQTFDSLMFE